MTEPNQTQINQSKLYRTKQKLTKPNQTCPTNNVIIVYQIKPSLVKKLKGRHFKDEKDLILVKDKAIK